jgi:hypothetical protein
MKDENQAKENPPNLAGEGEEGRGWGSSRDHVAGGRAGGRFPALARGGWGRSWVRDAGFVTGAL